MPIAADFEHAMGQLLPRGRVWEQFQQASSDLLTALAQEHARLSAAAELSLNEAIPDNADTDLAHWERIVGAPDTNLTDAERLARIRSLLFGRRHVSLSYLQGVVQAMAGDTNVLLYNRVYEPGAAGLANVGDSLAVGEWDATWLCELYPNALGMTTPDTFNEWAIFDTYTANTTRSPVAQTQTADTVQLPVSPDEAARDIAGTANDDTVYASIWCQAVAACDIIFGVIGRDGVERSTTFTLPAGVWNKLIISKSVGSGGSTPQLFMRGVGSDRDFYVSWVVAGIVDTDLEDRITALFPIHTHGHFGVQGEWATSKAHADQTEVIL